MLKEYVLGTEVARYGKMDIANISMTIKEFNLREGVDFIKSGGTTLLWKNSIEMPKYIQELIQNNTYTDLSEYVPYNYFMEMIDNTYIGIKEKFKVETIGDYTDVKGKHKKGKKFVKITDPFLKKIVFNKRLTKYVVGAEEIQELEEGKYISGYMNVSSKKALTWY